MTNKKIVRQSITICLVVFFLAAVHCKAQPQEPDHHPWWVNMGGGTGLVGSAGTMTAGFEYSEQFDSMILSGRLLGSTNKNPTILEYSPSDVVYKMAEYAVLYGQAYQYGNYLISGPVQESDWCGRSTKTETCDIEAGTGSCHHFDGAAGNPHRHRIQRIFPAPIDAGFKFRRDKSVSDRTF